MSAHIMRVQQTLARKYHRPMCTWETSVSKRECVVCVCLFVCIVYG